MCKMFLFANFMYNCAKYNYIICLFVPICMSMRLNKNLPKSTEFLLPTLPFFTYLVLQRCGMV